MLVVASTEVGILATSDTHVTEKKKEPNIDHHVAVAGTRARDEGYTLSSAQRASVKFFFFRCPCFSYIVHDAGREE